MIASITTSSPPSPSPPSSLPPPPPSPSPSPPPPPPTLPPPLIQELRNKEESLTPPSSSSPTPPPLSLQEQTDSLFTGQTNVLAQEPPLKPYHHFNSTTTSSSSSTLQPPIATKTHNQELGGFSDQERRSIVEENPSSSITSSTTTPPLSLQERSTFQRSTSNLQATLIDMKENPSSSTPKPSHSFFKPPTPAKPSLSDDLHTPLLQKESKEQTDSLFKGQTNVLAQEPPLKPYHHFNSTTTPSSFSTPQPPIPTNARTPNQELGGFSVQESNVEESLGINEPNIVR
ncbi:hypothetical protein AQUCO_03400019v1 [Aquilegia coerulea]|uniref:Uncharacterized protein n=1 Tax=Aquilegia coerulea TaxID=218851 RepID=A0A2G5CX32_AQUCA|nr:hypothetical protein AQUCO_03400019v1 [Aquilegia coerulea]